MNNNALVFAISAFQHPASECKLIKGLALASLAALCILNE